MHSYHIQLIRNGVGDLHVCSTTVAGILITTPTEDSPNGHIALGLRGGANYPNTWHMIAGAAKYSAKLFEDNYYSIIDIFRSTELIEEIGIDPSLAIIKPCARLHDLGLAKPPGDINYFFTVETGVSKEELVSLWTKNSHEDKGEHQRIIFIPNDTESIVSFLKANYYGITENKRNRPDNERELLHPAALGLIAYTGISIELLEEIAANNSKH